MTEAVQYSSYSVVWLLLLAASSNRFFQRAPVKYEYGTPSDRRGCQDRGFFTTSCYVSCHATGHNHGMRPSDPSQYGAWCLTARSGPSA